MTNASRLVTERQTMISDNADVRHDSSGRASPQPEHAQSEAPESFGRVGSLEVRLARTNEEIEAAQRLRYHVFYEEMSAEPDAETLRTRRDADRFDEICDHLMVVDRTLVPESHREGDPIPEEAVVGCYRLLRQEVADRHGGFYTASEYALQPLLEGAGAGLRFLELGRSCVLAPYRNRPTVELLWHGIMNYVALHNLDVMFGCASFGTTDVESLALPLSYLHHYHGAPEEWSVSALPERYVEMNRIPKDEIELRPAVRRLPPMIKGYIRAGCYIGDGAVVDWQFGTTDVLILFPVSQISERYASKFGQKNRGPRDQAD